VAELTPVATEDIHEVRESIPSEFDVKIFRVTIAVCSLLFALNAVFAQTLPSDTSLTENPIFQKNCAKCHGKTAEGRHFGGPSLISETTGTTDDLRNIITKGKGRMPKYSSKLKSEEIDTLVRQINALNKK
jgi:cytochrome c2